MGFERGGRHGKTSPHDAGKKHRWVVQMNRECLCHRHDQYNKERHNGDQLCLNVNFHRQNQNYEDETSAVHR